MANELEKRRLLAEIEQLAAQADTATESEARRKLVGTIAEATVEYQAKD